MERVYKNSWLNKLYKKATALAGGEGTDGYSLKDL